jgi:hypothetical protein
VRVLGTDHRPSPSARVVHWGYHAARAVDRVAGRDGTLDLAHVQTASEPYELAFRGTDGSVAAVSVVISQPGRVDVEATLRASTDPGVVHIRVVDARNQPVADARVDAGAIDVASFTSVPTDRRGETAIDLHDLHLAHIEVRTPSDTAAHVNVELPQRGPTTMIVK